MNRDSLRASMSTLVANALPKNAKRFRFSFFDDQPSHNALGMRVDPQPIEGKIIAHAEDAFIVKPDRATFVAVDRALATLCPALGDKVRVTPYCCRNFAGERLDAPREEQQETIDGHPYIVKKILIGGSPLHIPLPTEPHCQYLTDMVQQLELLPTPDRMRTIVNMLVDAKAKEIEIVDPDDKNLFKTPPEISFAVDTSKFTGRIAVIYDRGLDLYVVELRVAGKVLNRIEEVDVTSLAEVMTDLIDDGQWRRIRVEILGSATTPAARSRNRREQRESVAEMS